MTSPLLPDMAINDIRAISDAGLMHTAQRGTVTSVRQPGGRYVETWYYGAPIPGRLSPISEADRARADQPSAAGDWLAVLPTGTPIVAGDRWFWKGETAGIPWTRTVLVMRVLHPKPNEINRRAICLDVEGNA